MVVEVETARKSKDLVENVLQERDGDGVVQHLHPDHAGVAVHFIALGCTTS